MRHVSSLFKAVAELLTRIQKNEKGNVAILIAIAFTAIVGFAALGTEVARWYMTKRIMQSAADAAASAAAANLAANSSATSTQLQSDGKAVAAQFNFTDGSGGTSVIVNNPPGSGPYSGNSLYVQVDITQPQTPLLTALFLSTGPTIAASATAKANRQAGDSGCVLALSGASVVDVQVNGNVNMTFNSCAMYDNSPLSGGALTMGNNTSISAAAVYISGTANQTSGITTTDGIWTGVNPTPDPYLSVTQPTSSTTCNGWTPNGNQDLHLTSSNPSATLRPSSAGGTCAIPQNIKMDSAGTTLNFCPGVYVFNGGSLLDNAGAGGATINAPPTSTTNPAMSSTLCPGDTTGGVTLVFANGNNGPGTIQINAQATINLTAPTTGATAGLAIFQARTTCTGNGNGNNGCNSLLQGGATQNITGAIYLPNNAVSYTAGSATGGAQCTQLIANTITFSGAATFNNNCVGTGTKTISRTNGQLVM